MTKQEKQLKQAELCELEALDQAKNAVDPELSFDESEASAQFGITLLKLAAVLRACAA